MNGIIAAISTPPGKGGVALIRISGEGTAELLDRVFRPRSGRPMSSYPPRHAVWGDIIEGERPIDDGIATLFSAPASYTGEDMAEITCHGGALISAKVLGAVYAAGATPAEAGEFTRRAFLSGKLTLTDAESVSLLLEAKTDAQLAVSACAAREKMRERTGHISEMLLSLLSSLYASIDYPDEDLGELTSDQILASLEQAKAETEALAATYRAGHAVAEGIPAVLCGRPNVGKSSVYNCLVGDDVAIVTDTAGTTRDVLERTVSVEGVTLRLMDTAGLRQTYEQVEQIGIDRARAAMDKAELILAVFDGSAPLGEEDLAWLEELKHRKHQTLAIVNKSDRETAVDVDRLKDAARAVCFCTAKEGDVSSLRRSIASLYLDEGFVPGESATVISARQKASLDRALTHMEAATLAFCSGLAQDAASTDIEMALSALGELDGRQVSEAIVGEIFSRFCVGK